MIASPCINCCQMDKTTGRCEGCFRTIDEIAAWANADDQQKSVILAAIAQRRERLAPVAELVCNCADI